MIIEHAENSPSPVHGCTHTAI